MKLEAQSWPLSEILLVHQQRALVRRSELVLLDFMPLIDLGWLPQSLPSVEGAESGLISPSTVDSATSEWTLIQAQLNVGGEAGNHAFRGLYVD